nr:MAG TPA: hypothetical protein [Caudoviricetes sp.]
MSTCHMSVIGTLCVFYVILFHIECLHSFVKGVSTHPVKTSMAYGEVAHRCCYNFSSLM